MRIKSLQTSASKYMIFLDLLLAWTAAFILSRTNRQSVSMPAAIVAMVLWLCCAFLRYPKRELFFQKFTLSFFAFALFVLIVCGWYLGPITAFNNVLSQTATFCGIFLFYLYSEKFPKKQFQILLAGILVIFLLQNIKLFMLCSKYPNIGRYIIAGLADNEISGSVANPYGIAQASCLIVIAICRVVSSRKFTASIKSGVLLTVLAAVLAMTVYEVQSTITTLVMLLGSIGAVALSIFERKKERNLRWLAVIGSLLVLLFFLLIMRRKEIGNVIISMFSDRKSVFSIRVTEIGRTLALNEMSHDFQERLSLLRQSVDTFFKYPLLGALYPAGDLSGGHSALLDLFARYGLLGSVPQLLTILFYFRWLKKKMQNFDCFLWLPLLIVSILNPLSMYQAYFAAFFIAPAIYFAFREKSETDAAEHFSPCGSGLLSENHEDQK